MVHIFFKKYIMLCSLVFIVSTFGTLGHKTRNNKEADSIVGLGLQLNEATNYMYIHDFIRKQYT